MEEIDISQLLGYFKTKIIYIIFAMSVAFCLSSIYVNRFRVPEYTSSTTILLNQSGESNSISSTDVTLNKSLVTTYSEIIKSKRVLRQVINELSLDLEYVELAAKVNVSEITDTSIIKISVTDPDSQLAADIANAIAQIFSREIVDIYNIENISIIDAAEVSTIASSTSTIKIIGVATIAGAVIAVALIFVIFYFDTTVKNEEDIEKATGLPVIGIVPVSREKIKGSAHRKRYEELAKKHKTQEILPVEREVRRIDLSQKSTDKEIGVSVLPTEVEPIEPIIMPVEKNDKAIKEDKVLIEIGDEGFVADEEEKPKVVKAKRKSSSYKRTYNYKKTSKK